MIAQYYTLIYTIIVILFAIPVLLRYADGWTLYDEEREVEPIAPSLLFTIVIIMFIGLRPNSPVFADGPGYWFGILDHRWENFTLKDVNYQFAMKYLTSFLSSNNFHPRVGFIVYATVIYGGAFVAMRRLYPCDTMLAMVLYCGTFGVFGGAVNGIKNGMACSMFLCALAYKDNWKICILFLALSFGFHHSLEMSIAAFVLCLFYRKTEHYYILWGVSFLIAALHITFFQTFFANFTDEHGAGYLITTADSWVTGFRLDFILYSAAPLALGWWAKSQIDIEDSSYACYLNVYLLMNSIWLLCMYAAFTNRISALSWSLFPILILEPLLKYNISDNQHKVLVWFVIGQLAFTLLIAILYI